MEKNNNNNLEIAQMQSEISELSNEIERISIYSNQIQINNFLCEGLQQVLKNQSSISQRLDKLLEHEQKEDKDANNQP